ncbi:hypothetical protein GCM10020000_43000 [Streptomyces olivoverticillatus]
MGLGRGQRSVAENADGPPAQVDRNSAEGTRRPETAASAGAQENGQDGSRTLAWHTGLVRRPWGRRWASCHSPVEGWAAYLFGCVQ